MVSVLNKDVDEKHNNVTLKFVCACFTVIILLAILVSLASYYIVRSYNLHQAALVTQDKLVNSLYINFDANTLKQAKEELTGTAVYFKKISGAKAIVLYDKQGKRIWTSNDSYLVDQKPIRKTFSSRLFSNDDSMTLEKDLANSELWMEIVKNNHSLFTQQVSVFSKTKEKIGVARLAIDLSSALNNSLLVALLMFSLVFISCIVVFLVLLLRLKKVLKTIDKQEKKLSDNVDNLSLLLKANQTMRESIQTASARAVELNEQFLRRVGADLHDGPAQMIGYANMSLSRIANMDIAKEFGHDFQNVRQALEDSLDDIRGISSGLVLPELKNMTLKKCLRKVISIHGMQSKAQVIEKFVDVPSDVPLPIKICAYRFVQEGLNNAEQHGAADICRLSVRYNKGMLTIVLKDNGKGFRISILKNDSNHLGLIGLKDRIESIGGTFHINSELGVGTALKFSVNCDDSNLISDT